SLLITFLGSIIFIQHPSKVTLITLYAFFGFSTIFMMWGALIKTTHLIGGESMRSTSMGALDAGRGLIAALMGSLLVLIISKNFPNLTDIQQQLSAIKVIYYVTGALIVIIAIGVWFSLN